MPFFSKLLGLFFSLTALVSVVESADLQQGISQIDNISFWKIIKSNIVEQHGRLKNLYYMKPDDKSEMRDICKSVAKASKEYKKSFQEWAKNTQGKNLNNEQIEFDSLVKEIKEKLTEIDFACSSLTWSGRTKNSLKSMLRSNKAQEQAVDRDSSSAEMTAFTGVITDLQRQIDDMKNIQDKDEKSKVCQIFWKVNVELEHVDKEIKQTTQESLVGLSKVKTTLSKMRKEVEKLIKQRKVDCQGFKPSPLKKAKHALGLAGKSKRKNRRKPISESESLEISESSDEDFSNVNSKDKDENKRSSLKEKLKSAFGMGKKIPASESNKRAEKMDPNGRNKSDKPQITSSVVRSSGTAPVVSTVAINNRNSTSHSRNNLADNGP